MLLPRGMTQTFVDYVRRVYGVKMVRQPERVVASQGVVYRGLWGEGLLVVREHYPNNPDAETVEVHCGDLERLKELETNWHYWTYAQATKEATKDEDQTQGERS